MSGGKADSSNNGTASRRRSIKGELMRITTAKRYVPRSGYVLLLLLFVLTQVVLISIAGREGQIMIGKTVFYLRDAAGIFSSLGNMCIILIVLLYRKTGFITGMIIVFGQFPMMLINIVVRHNYGALPGVFGNIFTLVMVILLYITQRRIDRYQKKVLEQALIDPLTGLPNRYAGREYFDRLIKKGEKFIYVASDINNFKSINDSMGYEVGNRILNEIANRFRELADSGKTGTFNLVAHVGGDEFGFSIQDYSSEEDVLKTIRLFREELERKITIDDFDYYVNSSFGYAEYPTDAKDVETLVSFSSMALHEAKRRGFVKDPLRFQNELLESEQNIETERKIREALDTDEVVCYLQPQFDTSHNLRGFEALARIKNKDGSYISPAEFIPVAEKTGLVDRIDMCVFRKAAEFMESAGKEGQTDFTVSVNISVKHLQKNSFMEELRGILDTYDVAPERLEIEITESVMIDSVERALERINEVKKLGIMVAIDDFGTGYSSLSYLHSLPANLLKIDKSFIDEMNTEESNKQYVQSIISIGHVMGLEVISEGVENEYQLDTLKEIGCDYIQGFLWGRPMPAEDAKKLI